MRERTTGSLWARSRREQEIREERWKLEEGNRTLHRAIKKARANLNINEFCEWSESIAMAPMTGRRTSDNQTPPGRNNLRETRTDEAALRLMARRTSDSTATATSLHLSSQPARRYRQPPSSSSSNETQVGRNAAASAAGVEISPINSERNTPEVAPPLTSEGRLGREPDLVAGATCEGGRPPLSTGTVLNRRPTRSHL
eukprot:GHVU01116377.1.p2 GENE.GHVU01116377.1~~GHVU01116377.1.p2  ORF type:complete len:199 (+),score=18.32 GHVU01116377.1:374-970(+)